MKLDRKTRLICGNVGHFGIFYVHKVENRLILECTYCGKTTEFKIEDE